ncbi:hypothetical protein SGLAM104S_01186 [Streptomyces glaucescens]
MAASQARSAASAIAAEATPSWPNRRVMAASTARSRAASASAGVVCRQASGSARATRSGWKT